MTMLMSRFERIKDEHNRTAYLVPCRTCYRSTKVVATAGMRPEVVAKKAEQRGYEVDKHGHATCPVCVEAERIKPKRETTVKPSPDIAASPTVAVLGPREPTQTDKRRIFREIDDNWDEAKARYTGTNTDQIIADRLNVPRAWVAAARIEAFGDAMRNEAAEKAMIELKDLRRNAGDAMNKAFAAAAAIEVQMALIDEAIKKVEKLS